jgi:hypothetical protein
MIKEQVISAVQSSNLAWSEIETKAIDRITALGLSDPLGSALWRFKYLHDSASYKRALYLLVSKARGRLKTKDLGYVINMSTGVMIEWSVDACDVCHGVGSYPALRGLNDKCPKCDGTGIKRYTDFERESNCKIPHGSWNRGHNRVFDEIMVCLTGSASATGGKVSVLLKD